MQLDAQDIENMHSSILKALEGIDKKVGKRGDNIINVPKQDVPDVRVEPQINVDMSKMPAPQVTVNHPRIKQINVVRARDGRIDHVIPIYSDDK